jgi:hypothetical protein
MPRQNVFGERRLMKTKTPKVKTKQGFPAELRPCSWLKGENFFYIDAETPHLVLYTMANRANALDDPHGEASMFSKMPNFIDPDPWVSIMHQTAGYACHSYYLHARFLKPKDFMHDLYRKLLAKFNDSCISRVPPLKTAVEYEKILNEHNLTANNSYEYLEEGFYPLDIECLKAVINEKFPKNLQDLVAKPKTKSKKALWSFLNYVPFNLAILGPNCD